LHGDLPEHTRDFLVRIGAEWDKLTPEELDRAETWADETLR
jgi:hypothetical protein